MIPLAIPAAVSLANTAVATWNRMADARAAAKAQPQPVVDFQSLLRQQGGAGDGQALAQKLKAVPEVAAALAGQPAGARVNFAATADGSLYQVMPGGAVQKIALSAQSQAAVRQLSSGAGGASGVIGVSLGA